MGDYHRQLNKINGCYKLITLFPKQALLNTLYNMLGKEKKISFVFGSPVTMPDQEGGPGVPNVSEMIKIIEKRMEDLGSLEDYYLNVGNVEGAEKYQKSFEYICGWHDQDLANSIIEEAVIAGCSNDGGVTINHPDSLNDFANFVDKAQIQSQSIITTNFDPLIQNCFDKNSIKYHYYILDDDGYINRPKGPDTDLISIYHIHGFWKDAATLHTVSQLTHERNRLSDSLKDIIGDSTVFVLGYGGWDDIFVKSLKDTFSAKNIKGNVIWAFYENDVQKVTSNYNKLFSNVSRGLLNHKFRCYGGINCKTFFKEMNSFIEEKSGFPTSITEDVIKTARESLKSKQQSVVVTHDNQQDFLKKTIIESKPYHNFIRVEIRQYSVSTLNNEGFLAITSVLGADKYAFIGSVLNCDTILSKLPIYKIDISKIENKEDLLREFERQIGVNLAPFISMHTESARCVLMIDNSMNLDLINWREDFSSILSTVKKNKNIKIIILGDNTLPLLGFPLVKVTALDNPDLFSYIQNHIYYKEEYLSPNNFHKIKGISKSLPENIDQLLYDLTVTTLSEYIKSDIINEPEQLSYTESSQVHSYYAELIKDLSLSEKKENKDSLELLKILTIFEYGETFSNIKRYYSSNKFKISSIHWLLNHGLVNVQHRYVNIYRETVKTSAIIITINPLISPLVKALIEPDEKIRLIKQGLELSLGLFWMSGDVRFNNNIQNQITESHSYGPGNVHSLMCQYIKHSINEGLEREYKALFYSSLCYIDLLYDKGRFNDAYISADETYDLFSDTDIDISSYKLLIRKANAMRMLSMYTESEEIFEGILSKQIKLTKSEKIDIYIELAHIKDARSDEAGAKKYIELVKKITSNKSTEWIGVESIAANYIPEELRIKRLNFLQRKAKSLKLNHRENNITLQIAQNVKDKKSKSELYDKVIKSSPDEYTKIRAIVRKALNNINNDAYELITIKDKEEIKDAYVYLFTQRLGNLNSFCHEILWKVYSTENNLQSLLNLYRHSSIIWQLNGEIKKDMKYLKDLYLKKEDFKHTESAELYKELIVKRVEEDPI